MHASRLSSAWNLKLTTTGSKNETSLKKDRPDLIDQRGSLCNEARSNLVQRLNIELLFTLEVDEAHCWTRRCFRDALCIPVVVFLRFNIGANILGRHQANFVPSSREKSTKMMSAAACLHSNDAR